MVVIDTNMNGKTAVNGKKDAILESRTAKNVDGNDKDKEMESGNFEQFNLSSEMIGKLKQRNVTYLYPIQVACLELIRSGRDIVAQARTGTGKTFAFAIPLIEKLEKLGKSEINQRRSPKVVVLAPTRELAKQISNDFTSISTKLKTVSVYGGVRYEQQEAEMNNGVDVISGTPGRMLDFIQSGTIDFSRVDHVVLDEVDRMLDMGFQDSVEEILMSIYTDERKSSRPQTLFFSATCPSWVKRIAQKYMSPDFEFIDLIGDSKLKTSVNVEHLAIQCSYQDRASTIGTVLQVYSGKHGRAMIFCHTKKDADELACSTEIKQESHVMHGDIPQDKREMVLQKFRSGKYRVLITTDVAARGLDVPEVDLVIQCNPPGDYESYVHRSGRTGRAGRKGVCVCFYKSTETNALMQLENKTGIKFKRVGAPGTAEIVEAAINDAVRSLDTVAEDLIDRFRAGAEDVLKSKDPVSAIAAALAVISGCTKISQRSILTSKENYTTYHLYKTDEEIRGKSFAFALIKKMIGDENAEKAINKVAFTKDKMGLVFDISSEYDEIIQQNWYNTKSLIMNQITELPEIVEEQGGYGGGDRGGNRRGGGGRFNGGGGGGRFNNGGGNRRGGYGSRDNNGGGGGGFKRPFNSSSSTPSKKIKFDD